MSLSSLAALWGMLVLPAVVLLYFLKRKRNEHVISSTLLWKQATQDLRVNSPFQRLRKNLLLLLQLLILALVVFALAGPALNRRAMISNRTPPTKVAESRILLSVVVMKPVKSGRLRRTTRPVA